ncbi:Cell division cycle protein [Erysiphe necator]|uniref:Putative cell division cycle protein n=1 Tax=Uncinula necator TaxID=52586 RepID=A0A0B1P021_UNCNE|nr:Cell division cycle protein [Erysiphe necator]KHJ30174.1 putative cell division cycle protein [Erysiphe necator]
MAEDHHMPSGSELDFEPVSRSHILHCSYDYWHPKYRSSAIKSKIIPLPQSFVKYLCTDGIFLSNDALPITSSPSSYDTDFSKFSEVENSEKSNTSPSVAFPALHEKIKESIAELGGLVAPKLNWSAPKDATWISMKKNSMECATPDDIYLLFKSSDFVAFDLEHVFEGTIEDKSICKEDIKYVLVLRKWFQVNTSFEFRCFVRRRKLIAISQRDINYFDFLSSLKDKIRDAILNFFNKVLKDSFPDPNYVFDVYLPEPFERVRLMDINAWAPRTDPLLFSWHELLSLPYNESSGIALEQDFYQHMPQCYSSLKNQFSCTNNLIEMPEFRIVKKSDQQAFKFASPQYSAHKVPHEVAQAGLMGQNGIQEFAGQWEQMLRGEFEMQSGFSSDDEGAD